MAGLWIKWAKGLHNRRETIVMAARLRRDRHEIAGRLMAFWEWCDDNFTDADIAEGTVDVVVDIGKDPIPFINELTGLKKIAEAMCDDSIGWIRLEPDGRVRLPNFARHNGNTAKNRAMEQEKKRLQRSREKEAEVSAAGQTAPIHPVPRPDDDGTKTGTSIGTTEGTKTGTAAGTESGTKTGPEERREDKRIRENTNSPPPPPPQTSPGDTASGALPAEWEEVEGILRKYIAASSKAVQAAQRRGIAPAEVRGCIRHFEASPGKWDGGALFFKLTNAQPGEAVEIGWPAPIVPIATRGADGAAARSASIQRRDADLALASGENAADQAKRLAENGERHRLETAFGPDLDGWSETEFVAFLEEFIDECPHWAPLRGKGRLSSGRQHFLRRLESRAATASGPAPGRNTP